MLYWLYTEGEKALRSLWVALMCFSVAMPIILCLVLGRGIQRSDKESQMTAVGWRRLFFIATLGVVVLTVTAFYLSISQRFAIVPRTGKETTNAIILIISGGPNSVDKLRLFTSGLMWLFLVLITYVVLKQGVRNGGWLRERIDRLRRPTVQRGAMGSAHFCTSREYRRYRRFDKDGVTFYGAFWGKDQVRLDFGYGQFCLSGEDAARGILTLGGPGSGKTQGVILPIIADRMLSHHSLIVADPQGEITRYVLDFAKVSGHLVVIHDPTAQSEGACYNLAEGITNVSDARAIANVLIPSAEGDNRFWTDSATALLAACLIHFDNLGDIYSALSDLKKLADVFKNNPGDAALLANSFVASVGTDGKVASNVVATLATALTGWADKVTRANTSSSDFEAALIVSQPVVVMLTCPGRMRDVYASYLGATLRKLMLDLDTIGERNKGPLPMPVGIILDEFPTLGRLDSLVADVNLVRKRRISILIGAQSKGQFQRLYGQDGTQSLFTGLATQIVYGGCDFETAEYYSKASGMTTADANPDPAKANLRQRPLLTADEVITPLNGNCTLFARYIEAAYATQIVLTAQLTRLYERADWTQRIGMAEDNEPMILTRTRTVTVPQPTKSLEKPTDNGVTLADETLAATTAQVDRVMDKAATKTFSADRYKNATRAKQGRR